MEDVICHNCERRFPLHDGFEREPGSLIAYAVKRDGDALPWPPFRSLQFLLAALLIGLWVAERLLSERRDTT